ncbi:MAG TPA: hypothetical protein PLB54_00025 [Nitrosomonas sp.]|nr:hypothetical protein [Nitrosomonas sp.]
MKEVVKYSLLKNSANRYFGTAASKGEELIKAKRDKNRQFELFSQGICETCNFCHQEKSHKMASSQCFRFQVADIFAKQL